jgi:acetolactate synthase-1/3 small subunit
MATIYSDDNNTDVKRAFTLSIFTENYSGLLYRVTQIFTRRKINIDSIAASQSEVKGVYRYTIVVEETEETVRKLITQIEKQVEVLVAFYSDVEDMIYQEIALYKIKTETLTSTNVEKIVRDNNARFLSVDQHFCVIEKTGHKEETEELFNKLEPFGVQEFVRSGRVAVSKEEKNLSTYLRELENN